jgi:hypothetical protein
MRFNHISRLTVYWRRLRQLHTRYFNSVCTAAGNRSLTCGNLKSVVKQTVSAQGEEREKEGLMDAGPYHCLRRLLKVVPFVLPERVQ